MQVKKNQIIRGIAITISVYLLLYAINTYFGGYWPILVAGRHEIGDSTVKLHTQLLWQPYFGYTDDYNSSFIGYVFFPAIDCDRRWFHENLDYIDDFNCLYASDGSVKIKWHPVGIQMVNESERKEAVRIARMVKDPEFCMSEAGNGNKKERHLIAIILFDTYGCKAIEMLALKSSSAKNKFEEDSYNDTNEELFAVVKKFYDELKAQYCIEGWPISVSGQERK